MGLFDGLMNLSPEQNQGLLAAAAQMLQASGPSRTPVGLGQILGGGLQAYQGGMDAATQRRREQEQARQMAMLTGLKIKDAESDLKHQDMVRARQKRITDRLSSLADPSAGGPSGGLMNPDGQTPASHMGGGEFYRAAEGAGLSTDNGTLNRIVDLVNQGQTPTQAAASLSGRGAQMASAMPGPEGSPKIGGPDWLQAYQQQNGRTLPTMPTAAPAPAAPKANKTEAFVQRLMSEAEVYAAEGDFEGADKRYQMALKLSPQVDRVETAVQNGQPVRVITYKDGTEKVSAFGAKPDMQEISLGDTKLFRDKNTIQNGEAFTMGYSPGDQVSMRGQNMTDRRSRDANAIAAGAKVTATSTNLRKEFDDLPEVKNYKQALPVYTSIVDATKRNTTQSDINIVYGIAKLYDPTSVVREGEYATVANSPNIPERLKGYAQYLAGGGRLTQQVKNELLAEAKGRMGSYEQPYVAARQSYTTISKSSGADPKLLFPSEHQSPIPKQGTVRKYNPATGRIE